MFPTTRPLKSPRPPAEDAPAAERLGWSLRLRRGERTRRQLRDRLGYSVSTIKQVETGAYRSDLGPFMRRWAEAHGGLDEELRRLWEEVQAARAASDRTARPAPPPPRTDGLARTSVQGPAGVQAPADAPTPAGVQGPAGVITLPAAPPGMAYVVIPVPIEELAGTLGPRFGDVLYTLGLRPD